MNNNPVPKKDMDEATFRNNYYLKESLICFCKENGLPAAGGKIELTERIALFLRNGDILTAVNGTKKTKANVDEITENSLIEANITCSEKLRAFFKEKLGDTFSFNVQFQKWLKQSEGNTYADAVEAYTKILQDKKNSRCEIDRQFEYNTYIRDFFAENKGKNLSEAITCWKYKKSLPGHHCYEKDDLCALK